VKKILLLIALIAFPASAHAADPLFDLPRWSFELKGGVFAPDLPNFEQFYGRTDMPGFGAALAYKPFRLIEVGLESGLMKEKGFAFAPLHNEAAGEVTYQLVPVNVFVLLRGVLDEDQWLVPYVGGGYTRMLYSVKTEGQGTVKGVANGYHARAGLQLLLDVMDPEAANNLYMDYSVNNTYLFVEAEFISAKEKTTSIDLGGMAVMAGLLFEY
jgi:opacity protein-like surface antigen